MNVQHLERCCSVVYVHDLAWTGSAHGDQAVRQRLAELKMLVGQNGGLNCYLLVLGHSSQKVTRKALKRLASWKFWRGYRMYARKVATLHTQGEVWLLFGNGQR